MTTDQYLATDQSSLCFGFQQKYKDEYEVVISFRFYVRDEQRI
jgi:hypothetical protein